MSKLPIFAIPVRPHVRQFLLLMFGPEQPWPMHQNSFVGSIVRMKVEKQPYRQLRKPAPLVPAGKHYLLTLPTALKHYTLTPESAKQVGESLDKFFRQQLISFVLGHVAASQNERAALRHFCNFYCIDPSDADLETLRKVYRDYKDSVLRENGQDYLLYGAGREQLHSDFAVAS